MPGAEIWRLGALFMAGVQARDEAAVKERLKEMLALIAHECGDNFSTRKLRTFQVLTNANRAAFNAGAATDDLGRQSLAAIEGIGRAATPEELNRFALDLVAHTVRLIPSRDAYRERLTSEAVAYIRGHFKEDLTRGGMAARLRCSPAHFSRVFAQNTGFGFREFLMKCRCEAAMELLRQTHLQVAEIAAAVGCRDPFHFSRMFRQHVGVSPRRFRQSPGFAAPGDPRA